MKKVSKKPNQQYIIDDNWRFQMRAYIAIMFLMITFAACVATAIYFQTNMTFTQYILLVTICELVVLFFTMREI